MSKLILVMDVLLAAFFSILMVKEFSHKNSLYLGHGHYEFVGYLSEDHRQMTSGII